MMKLFTTKLLNRSGMTLEQWQINLLWVKKCAMICLILLLVCFGQLAAQTTNTQNFEGNSLSPWTSSGSNGTYLFVTTAGTHPGQSPHGGGYELDWNSFSLTSGSQILYSPVVDYSGRGSNTPTISFWFYRDVTAYTGSSYSAEGVNVYVSTTTSGGTLLGFIPRDGTAGYSGSYIAGGTSAPGATGWYQYTFNVPSTYNTATNYIILNFNSQYGDDCYMDDITYISYPGIANCGWNGGGATYVGGGVGCSSQNFSIPSTSYFEFDGNAGVNYTFGLSGGGWSSYNMIYWEYNGSAWIPKATNGGSTPWSVTSSVTSPSGSGWNLITVSNGTACPPTWISNSAVLSYQITTPTTPAISESPSGNVCNGSNVTYTASGISLGSFAYFQYQWNGTGGYTTGWITSNPGTWTSGSPGNTLYVEAVSNNGGCTATSSAVNVVINAASSTGSFVTSPIYSCVNGTLYNGSGTALAGEAISGYTGNIDGWGWGTNTSTCSANTAGFPYSAGSANMNLNCCWPGVGSGSTDVIFVQVTNGACPSAQNCISVTANNMAAPASASISPAGPLCAPVSGNITLSYSGGSGGAIPGGTLKWYTGSCGGTYIGSGQNLVITTPSSSTTYYCAWVDPCGNLTTCASATLTVITQPTVSAASYSICKNSTTTLSSSVGGTWVSNNTAVATVSGTTVTGVGAGTATFTFTSTASPFCTNTTSAVTVTALPAVSVTGPTSFCGTTTTTLSPTSGGTWVSNNTAVATVSGYTVTGTTAGGSTNFTFTSSTAPNCANTTANITVTGLPTVFGVTGGGTYCLGSSSVVGLSGSQSGVNYQLVLNGSTNVGSPVAGTGSAISFGGQSTVGTYTVVATTVTNSCVLSMSGNAIVTMLSPNVNNTTPTSIGTNGGTMNGTD